MIAGEEESDGLDWIWSVPWSYCYPVRGVVTIEDLYRVPDNRAAELIDGKIIVLPYLEALPGRATGRILVGLLAYTRQRGWGEPFGGKIGYQVDLPHRKSFSPRASLYNGPDMGWKFPLGGPVFAAEVRNSWEYGALIDEERAQKRADYFAAGTLVVWDVDLIGEDTVKVYRASDPTSVTIYRRGDAAEAEPAVPGWIMPVDEMFS
jgi:Uma2 family endonuclease